MWAPEHDTIIIDGRAAGISASKIASRLGRAGRRGTTRNAVIGRTWRLQSTTYIERCALLREQTKAKRAAKRAERRAFIALAVAPIDNNRALSRNDRIRAKRQAGLTCSEIASQYGVSRQRINQISLAHP